MDFYEEYVINLTDKQQEAFFEDNPNFMSEYPISHERIFLLKDRIFRNILHEIKEYKRKRLSNEI